MGPISQTVKEEIIKSSLDTACIYAAHVQFQHHETLFCISILWESMLLGYLAPSLSDSLFSNEDMQMAIDIHEKLFNIFSLQGNAN